MQVIKKTTAILLCLLMSLAAVTALPSVSAAEEKTYGTWDDKKAGFRYTYLDPEYETCRVEGLSITLAQAPENIVIPKKLGDAVVIKINGEAFYEVSSKSVTIPETVTEIGDIAFSKSALQSVTLPASVTKIGIGSFRSCANLETVILGEGISELSNECFANNPALANIYIPSNVKTISDNAITDYESLTVYGFSGTAAESFAEGKSNVTFVSLDGITKTALEAALTQAEKILSGDISIYTDKTAEALQKAYNNGKRVFENPIATQGEIDSAAKAIEDAIAKLEYNTNKTTLKEMLDSAKAVIDGGLEKYTEQSAKELQSAYESGSAVYEKLLATQEEADRAATAIEAAIAKLEYNTNKTTLKEMLDSAKAVIDGGLEKYTEQSAKELQSAYESGSAVYEKLLATQEEADRAATAIEDAIAKLEYNTNKTTLKEMLDSAKAVIDGGLEKYTEQSAKELQSAYESGSAVYEKLLATQEEADSAATAIEDAIAKLEYNTNKTTLKEMLDSAKAVIDGGLEKYTEQSAKELQSAYESGSAVYEKLLATQEEADSAAKAIEDAISNLKYRTDKTALKLSLDDAKAIIDGGLEKYTEQSASELQNAYTNADSVYKDENASAEEIGSAIEALENAVAGLKLKVVPGDVTGDGEVKLEDVLRIQSHIAQIRQLNEEQRLAADVTGDGDVNMQDVLKIQKFIAKIIPEL
ncbi:MAG: leucine-rich repeat protein [Acutalibacteraceae bacterium]